MASLLGQPSTLSSSKTPLDAQQLHHHPSSAATPDHSLFKARQKKLDLELEALKKHQHSEYLKSLRKLEVQWQERFDKIKLMMQLVRKQQELSLSATIRHINSSFIEEKAKLRRSMLSDCQNRLYTLKDARRKRTHYHHYYAAALPSAVCLPSKRLAADLDNNSSTGSNAVGPPMWDSGKLCCAINAPIRRWQK
ncbi:hypothetical protein EV182_006255 [Spiromyces aspiralis]|uniref:Uncharacterized protein n=1 Tax=Spiromyces aspiralis TaxID=68401 RepID=A0ACC1HMI1_9FUNG|nr:hypothetical protein EV182_006255 [Spiromyces aspiralis]